MNTIVNTQAVGLADNSQELAQAAARRARNNKLLRIVVPSVLVLLAIGLWELLVRINHVPDYIIPAPSVVLRTLLENWDSLFAALLFTLKLTFLSLALAVVGGVLLASVMQKLTNWLNRLINCL